MNKLSRLANCLNESCRSGARATVARRWSALFVSEGAGRVDVCRVPSWDDAGEGGDDQYEGGRGKQC